MNSGREAGRLLGDSGGKIPGGRFRGSYYVSEGVGFDGILSSQRNTAEDDEDEDEVGEVGMVDEVVAGHPQTEKEREKRQRRLG